jgi:uncharacterized membrane protein YiaA
LAVAPSKGDHPVLFSPLLPAISIAMVIGGVHSAGLFSFEMGLTVTAFFYSGPVFAAITICSKLRRRKPVDNAAR